jgi:retron-type reverse transcriptase
MLDPDLYVVAYNKIRGDSGALTKGTDNENIDGFSRQKIEKIIGSIKNHTYKFKPIRRVYIPKEDGKLRPLGIPCASDKIVQTVMALILEALYDNEKWPVFSDHSHGFRRGRGTHTALKGISH